MDGNFTITLQEGEKTLVFSFIGFRDSNTLGNNDALIVIDGVPARAGFYIRISKTFNFIQGKSFYND